jgi:hypothetical protein
VLLFKEFVMSGVFSKWQPKYAARGIATFPVAIEGKDKRPMNKGYQRTGLRGSAELAKRCLCLCSLVPANQLSSHILVS